MGLKGELVTKYMTFRLVEKKPKTTVWHVLNNRSGFLLGVISWYGAWRQYVFNPEYGSTFNNGCLETIQFFLTELNNRQRPVIPDYERNHILTNRDVL